MDLKRTRRAVLFFTFFLIFFFLLFPFWPLDGFSLGQEEAKEPDRVVSEKLEKSAMPAFPASSPYPEQYASPENGVSSAPSAKRENGDPEGEIPFLNILQCPRILFDKTPPPPSYIGLAQSFENVEHFQGAPLEFEIIDPGKKEIVEPRIEGDELVLTWKGIGKSEITLLVTNLDTGYQIYDVIRTEAWTPDYLTMTFTVLGGLGVFLLGMKYMSEGLQTIAGAGLRKMIATVTDNRFLAVIVGMFTTALIQSSSVTTVMVVGFINSQIMTLSQGIGVIMGANIGTTFTGWILVLNVGKYGLPMLGIAGFVYLFSKHDKIRFIAMTVMGLGFVFYGLELMQNGFAFLRELESFTSWMRSFRADTYFGVLKCASIGCILTLVVQSSSATLAITMSLAAIGVIEFETAAALVLGENVGTTITAFLASIGSTTNARRAAYFHIMFNLIGVLWITAIFLTVLIPLIRYIVGVNEAGEVLDIRQGIALTHTLFNVTNTLLFLPFTKVFARLLTWAVPDRGEKIRKHYLTGLHVKLLESSAISLERSRVEILRMFHGCTELAAWVEQNGKEPLPDEDIVEKSFGHEELLDVLQDEVIEFMADLLAGNVSHDVAEIARGQLRMADELESISDYLIVILKSTLKLQKSNLSLPEPIKSQIDDLHDHVESYLLMIERYYAARKEGHALMTEVYAQGRSITARVKKARDLFLKLMSDEKIDPQVIMAVNTQLNAYRRVREHAQNVAEAVTGVK